MAWSAVFELVIFLGLIHFWIKHQLSYWKRNGVCSVKGKYLLGNMKKFWKRHISEAMTESYQKLKHKDVIGGFYCFLRPILLVFDPTLIGYVLTKDAAYFAGRGLYQNGQDDALSKNLMTVEGHRWKELRTEITPTFTADKLKLIFDTTLQVVGAEFEQHVERIAKTGKPIDVTDLCSQFSIDCIAHCAFGAEDVNSFREPGNKFRKLARKSTSQSVVQRIKWFIAEAFPELSSLCLGVRVVDPKIGQYFTQIIEKSIAKNGGKGKVDNLLTEQIRSNNLTLDEICAQTMMFFTGHGYEATRITMAWCIYELAKNTQSTSGVQDKLIKEINKVLEKHQNIVNYEAVQEMTYLDQVVKETLRMHPTVPSLRRVTTSDYHVPDTTHILTKGTRVVIPVHAIHHDPVYYPRPEEFRPDRFSDAEVVQRPRHTFLPGGGWDESPRACIGMQFAVLQIKLGVVLLLRRYRLGVNGKTKGTIKINAKSQLCVPTGKIWIDMSEHE